MKKSLIALAVLGAFAGAASAQSSVTIYGLLDQGIAKSNDGTSVNPGSGDSTGNKWALQQGAASRLGFKGVEDLGGGLSAFFDFQHRFNPDTGSQSASAFWHAKSVVGLKGGFGTVTLGRDYVVAFWPAVNADPWGWDTVGQFGQKYTFANYGARDTSIRNNNQIAYTTPSFGGLTVTGAVDLAEGGGAATGLGRAFGFNAEYKGGPIYAAVGYDKTDVLDNGILPAGSSDPSLVVASFAYDFGVVRPVALYARAKDLAGETQSSIMVGLTAPIGNGTLKAGFARYKDNADDTTGKKIAVGYFYSLSKRTTIYGDVGSAKDTDESRTTSFDLGVKHTF